jgi:hypothetical protein
MSDWPAETIDKIAASDDLHVAPYRADGTTCGTPTWIWSVVIDRRLFVRAWNGVNSSWYRSAMVQRAGKITAVGQEYQVRFTPTSGPALDEIDAAYRAKYAGSPYLPPMVSTGPRAATMEITLLESASTH